MNLERYEISWDGQPAFYKVDRAAGIVFQEPLPLGSGMTRVTPEHRAEVLRALDEADKLPEEAERPGRKPAARSDVILAWDRTLKYFIGRHQRDALRSAMAGEEKQYFLDMLRDLAEKIEAMPKVYEQEKLGDQAIVHLHYFRGGMDWHITERDTSREQHQAFGLANLGYGGELGYISIAEVIAANVEIDLHWKPVTLEAIKAKE